MWLPTLRTALSSLGNHLAFVLFAFSAPMTLLFAAFAHQDGDLTLGRVARIAAVWSVLGVIGGLIGWYVILPPLLRRRGR